MTRRGLGSGRRSQASPVSFACSSGVNLLDKPQTMRLDSSRCAVTMIASNTSLAGTTSSEIGRPSFSAAATAAVNSSCS